MCVCMHAPEDAVAISAAVHTDEASLGAQWKAKGEEKDAKTKENAK